MPFADQWNPTPEEWGALTLEEKLVAIDALIDKATSDTQFAAKLKRALAIILTAEQVNP